MAKAMYVGVANKARKVKEVYVGVGFALPSGYTPVEYIQSSGSQYINTGFKPNNATRMVLDIDVTAKSSQCALFGARNAGGSSGFAVWTWNDNAGYQVDYGTRQFLGVGGNSSGRHILDLNQNVFYVDGSAVNISNAQSFSCSYNAYLFMVSSGGNLMTNYPCSAKLYACQIYDNGTKIRDFVPCKNPSGTVGLYDTVNGKFYTNEGTGSFTAGASLPISGVARKVLKAYVGVGGKARLFYVSESLYQYINWTQPKLSANGTIGGSSFAVSASTYHDSPRQPYCAFDGVTTNNDESGCWHSSAGFPQWIQFYNPNPLKVTALKIQNRSASGAYINSYGISYSDNGSNWTEFTTGTSPNQVDSGSFTVSINQGAHKYWRITAKSASGSNSSYVAIGEIFITAQEKVEKI